MGRFLWRIAAFALPLALIFGLSEWALRSLPNEYKLKDTYLKQHAAETQILFLGSSHAYFGVNPRWIVEPSFNSANVAQTLNYDYRIYAKYANQMKQLKCVVIPISYFTLFSRLEEGTEAWREKNYYLYYGIETSPKLEHRFETLNTSSRVNFGRLYDYYVSGRQTLRCSELGFGQAYMTAKQQNLIRTGELAARRHTKHGLPLLDYNRELLRKIILLAKAHGTQVIFYTPPAYSTYREHLDPTQLQRMIETMEAIDRDNTQVAYVNLLADEGFTAADFYDADHLGGSGAKKLTLRLYELVKRVSGDVFLCHPVAPLGSAAMSRK